MSFSREKYRVSIGRKVRELRLSRRWTQAELARQLRLSQARLSELERGAGSFTAEQFLRILQLFNAAVTDFDPGGARDPNAELQNALARLGAVELHESDQVLPSAQLQTLHNVLRETLIVGSPRLIAGLGPVLVRNVDRANFRGLYHQLAVLGLERRLAWAIESVRDAVREQLPASPPAAWSRRYRRALLLLDEFVEFLEQHAQRGNPGVALVDVLDSDIRSKQSLDKVQMTSSTISKKWGIVTSLQPQDFSSALRQARAGD